MKQQTNILIDIFNGIYNYSSEVANLFWAKISISAIITLLLNAVGYPNTAIIPLLILLCSDFVLGTCNSLFKRQECFCSTKALHGLVKIIGVYGAVALVIQFDIIVATAGFPGQYIVTNLAILLFGTTELTSCARHLDEMGIVKIDPRIIKRIKSYEERALSNEEGEERLEKK